MHLSFTRAMRTSGGFLVLTALTAPTALCQVSFSIDNHGPLIGAPDGFFGFPITEGDILTPATGPPFVANPPMLGAPIPPGILVSGGFGAPGPGLGLPAHGGCVGHPGGTPCPIEVDALSYGLDRPLPNTPLPPGSFWFSVDEWAFGLPAPFPPNVASEGAFGPGFEASADVFIDLGMPIPCPIPPFAVPPGNTGAIDGDGVPGATGFMYPGLGIIEPDFPGLPPDSGDNLDAVDVDTMAGVFPIYYSLDAPWPDPINGFPLQGSALFFGMSGADVLMTIAPGVGPFIFAPAPLLGLDIAGGPMSDDLDALALWENGTGAFEPAPFPFAWLGPAGPTDMLLFSVRRGSVVIGAPDSMFGIPIEEGDILSTPIAGGASPFPSIFVAAENLALATMRSGGPGNFADDLDALDVPGQGFPDCNTNGTPDPIDIVSGISSDCNGNGVPDECDVASGASLDCNGNGIPDECEPDCNSNGVPDDCDITAGTSNDCNGNGLPDECEQIGVNYCGPAVLNSSGLPAVISTAGVAVPGTPLVLQARQMPTNQFGYFLTSMNQGFFSPPASQGFVCLGANIGRYNGLVMNSGPTGSFCVPIGTLMMPTNPPQPVLVGQAWNFQCWFRDMNPGVTSNFTDGITVQY